MTIYHAVAASEAAQTAQRAALPTAVSGVTFLGVPLPEWVYVLTAVYTVLQIGGWVYDRWKGKR